MNSQRLHVSHIGKEREYLEMVDECPSLFLTALYLECKDTAAALWEILLIEFVRRVGRDGRVMHLCHLRMLAEIIHHLEGILHVTLNAQWQRLYALQENPRIER